MSYSWDIFELILSTFFFVAYLLILFYVIGDLFRNHKMSGIVKALWLIALVFVPMLTAVIYIIWHGVGMVDRQREAVERTMSDNEAYIKRVAGKSPANQIADAKALFDAGTINADEFAKLKAKALA